MNVVTILLGILFTVSAYANKNVMFTVFSYIPAASFAPTNTVTAENPASFRCLVHLVQSFPHQSA